MARSLLRAEAHNHLSPKEVLQRVNNHLRDLNEGEMFVTMLYGLIDRKARSFEYARAGHEVPVLCDPQGRSATAYFSGFPHTRPGFPHWTTSPWW